MIKTRAAAANRRTNTLAGGGVEDPLAAAADALAAAERGASWTCSTPAVGADAATALLVLPTLLPLRLTQVIGSSYPTDA